MTRPLVRSWLQTDLHDRPTASSASSSIVSTRNHAPPSVASVEEQPDARIIPAGRCRRSRRAGGCCCPWHLPQSAEPWTDRLTILLVVADDEHRHRFAPALASTGCRSGSIRGLQLRGGLAARRTMSSGRCVPMAPASRNCAKTLGFSTPRGPRTNELLAEVEDASGMSHVYLADVGDVIGPLVDTGFDTGADTACNDKSNEPFPCQNGDFTFSPDGQRSRSPRAAPTATRAVASSPSSICGRAS